MLPFFPRRQPKTNKTGPPNRRYDARLFNQSAGMDSGFGADDGYGVYSKPMFNRGEAQSVYKPKTDDGDAWGDADQQMSQLTGTERFRADRGFKVSIVFVVYCVC